LFDDVEKYCMFIGYPRSGHTLLGALLDAHPNAIIAHELDALGYVKQGIEREDLFQLIIENSRKFTEEGRKWESYSYEVPGQWRGQFAELEVIGDKKGGASARELGSYPELLPKLEQTVGNEVKLIHVVRNPYDNISTMFLNRRANRSLRRTVKNYFSLCETNMQVKEQVGDDAVFEVKHEDFVNNPRDYLQRLCHFLELEPREDYLRDCVSQVFASPRKSRYKVEWYDTTITMVGEYMSRYDFLEGYSYKE
jgi:hypothetical protein